MLAIEAAGFRGVGLIAKRSGAEGSDIYAVQQQRLGSSLQSEIQRHGRSVDVVLVLLIIFMVVVPLPDGAVRRRYPSPRASQIRRLRSANPS